MSKFRIAVHITPRKGLLDPQGKAVSDALNTLCFKGVKQVHIGRYIVIEGPIGAGKTSLARELALRLSADELLEQPDDNPFLARFYDDMARFALRSCSSASTSCAASHSSTCFAARRSPISCSTRTRSSRISTSPTRNTRSTTRCIRISSRRRPHPIS